MIHRLIALALCLQLAKACVPVRPGEDMPCPSVPLAPSATGYLTSGLKMKTENGAQVFYCNAPEFMISVDGSTPTMLTTATTIECKPNSGIFTLDGTNVGSKKYTCGDVLVPCPELPKYMGTPPADVTIGNMNGPTRAANGDQIYSCTAPDRLYKVTNNMPTTSMLLPAGTTAGCKRQVNMLIIMDGSDAAIDTATESFFCGAKACQTCPLNLVVDQMNNACTTQTGIFCKSKPMVMDDTNGCPAVSCTNPELLYLMTDATTSMPANNVECKNGNWEANGAALPPGAVGFVCGKAADCAAGCNRAVDDVFDSTNEIREMGVNTKPTCTYKCDPSSQLSYGGMSYESAVCNMETEKVTLTPSGVTPTATMKFTCKKCNCPTANLFGGSEGLCPIFELCTKPSAGSDPCTASCPAGSTALARALTGNPITGGASIKCTGDAWLDANADGGSGVTCQFPTGTGTTQDPPTVDNPCDPLGVAACPTGNCDDSQVGYVKYGGGYKVTCKSGILVYELAGATGAYQDIICDESGMFNPMADKVTCAMEDADAPVMDCLMQLTVAFQTQVKHQCKFGACYFSCIDPGKQLSYNVNGTPTTSMYLKCNGELLTVDGLDFPDDPMAMTCA